MKPFVVLLGILLLSCGEKTPLPDVIVSPDLFGANDTSYVHLTPDWDASYMGYSEAFIEPADIAIGDDGYLFVADKANNRIVTLSQAGQVLEYQNLDKIGPIENPVGLDIDSKLNLVIVNGSNTVYAWNQYINNIGVLSVITDQDSSGNYIFSDEQSKIDSVLGIYPIYIDPDPNASFQDVAFGPAGDNVLFVTDNGTNRIISLDLVIQTAVKLTNNRLHPLFVCTFNNTIASFGSGAGTVDDPRGIACDDNGNLYFTQLGGNFLVQKLLNDNSVYTSAYVLYEDPIMDLERFKGPMDVALGNDNAIFVVDAADSGRVSKFYNKGIKAGEPVDLGKQGLNQARFNNPMSIVVSDEEIVYIANTDDHRIERYQYTISDGDIPKDPQ